ncbi:MAG: alpha-amylase [Prolixibacteraceae bacterium]|nr:alpha-amylase [Prolixibacteraceae bacterium]MBN2649880.1 alpha-amylase [Prolixibacteraceae bacterium]
MKKLIFLSIAILFVACNPGQQEKKAKCVAPGNDEISVQVHFPEWSHDAVIYEVNVRQYTPEGTFEAFSEHLPRLKELGVEILWFMPIYPISEKNRKGTLGSYYAISDYTGVNPELGTFEDFKQLVEEAHSMGFKVLLDWVANHTGWDGSWIENHPDWFTHDSLGNIVSPVEDWSDVADLNYDNTQMRAAMIDAMQYWVSEADIDGYRCDVAGMVPVDFWNEARAALDSIKPVFMLAEDESEAELLHKAFNMNYGWEFHHIMNSIAQGEADANAVAGYYTKVDSVYPQGSYMMHFTSNHDENSWNGTVYERMGDAVKTMAALSFTLPGMPLIYSGQEAGNNKRLEFFEKDEIDWSNLEMQQFYAKLIDLKQQNKALWNGCAGGDIQFIDVHKDILVFIRAYKQNKVLAVFNLSGEALDISTIPDEICGTYTNEKNQLQETITQNKPMSLSAWEYKIFTSR